MIQLYESMMIASEHSFQESALAATFTSIAGSPAARDQLRREWREGGKSQDRLHWVGVASMRIVQAAKDARVKCGFDIKRAAAVQEVHLMSPVQEFPRFSPGKGILFLCLDGLQRAALPELKVIAEVELQGFEDLQAAHAQG